MRVQIISKSSLIGLSALLSLGGCATAAGGMGEAMAVAAGVPVMDGFLPYSTAVPATAPMAIDGTYAISTIGKRIRIEGGRAYAVDGWLHMMSLRIKPGMVVMRNFTETGNGTYQADDLPLMGRATLSEMPNGSLQVSIKGTIPAQYVLVPAGQQGGPPPAPPEYDYEEPPEAPSQDCELVDFHPDTGELICLD